MIAQDVINQVSADIRRVLSDSGSDATLMLQWIDRVQKKINRASRWKFLLSDVKTFSTVVGEDTYYFGASSAPVGSVDTGLGLSDVQIIKARSVVDRTNNKRLYPTDDKPLGDVFNQNGKPTVYRHDSVLGDVIQLYPPADGVYTIEFRYFKTRSSVSSTATPLQIPDDYKDIVVAGTNWFACMFLKKRDEAADWFSIYQDGLRELVRDSNLHPREDFIRPDYVSVPKNNVPAIYNPFQEVF